VSPVKSQTIRRLELVAALILSQLVVTVRNALEFVGSVETFLWTDYTVALCWINNSNPGNITSVLELMKSIDTLQDVSGIIVLVIQQTCLHTVYQEANSITMNHGGKDLSFYS